MQTMTTRFLSLHRSWLAVVIVLAFGFLPACGGGGGGNSPTAPTVAEPEAAAEPMSAEEPADEPEPAEEPPPAEDPEPAEDPAPAEDPEPAEEPEPAGNPDATATYRVTFDATWSASSHPTGFPDNAHLSGLIGATHLESTRFWAVGSTASNGIKEMAEIGSKSPLDSEIQSAINNGSAESLLSGGAIGSSPGSVQLTFDISAEQPFVTLVSMVAPSPDWFVGVSALSLMQNGDWAQTVVVDLFAYDAGTDGGGNYKSANKPLSPRQPIQRIEESPFRVNGSVRSLGTFTFRRIS